jgi:hypothetical protein
MDFRLLDSFAYALSAVAKATTIQVSQLLDKIAEAKYSVANSGYRLTPEVYAAHWTLIQQLRRKLLQDPDQFLSDAMAMTWSLASLLITEFPLANAGLGMQRRMHELLIEEHEDTYGLEIAIWGPDAEKITYSRSVLAQVMENLRTIDPSSLGETNALVSEIAFIDSDKLNAGSSFPIYGCIYLNVLRSGEPWTAYLEHIIHETAHHHLFSLWTTDPVVLNDKEALFDSPLRTEPRPLSAIFHQMFVLARVIRTWSLFQSSGRYGDEIYTAYTNYQNDKVGSTFVDKFWISAKTVEKHASLTQLGSALLAGCCSTVERFPVAFNG